MPMKLRIAAALLASVLAVPANAAVVLFNGSAVATASPFPDPTCAPLPFRGIISPAQSSGASNLGSFTYSHNVCTQGATGPVNGSFVIDFGAAAISGLLTGSSVARAGTPGLFDQMFTYTITGGTAQFAGATGSFTNIGTVDTRGGLPSRLTLNFAGAINAPAVPEPATWMMTIGGFGLMGAALRRRNKAIAIAVS